MVQRLVVLNLGPPIHLLILHPPFQVVGAAVEIIRYSRDALWCAFGKVSAPVTLRATSPSSLWASLSSPISVVLLRRDRAHPSNDVLFPVESIPCSAKNPGEEETPVGV